MQIFCNGEIRRTREILLGYSVTGFSGPENPVPEYPNNICLFLRISSLNTRAASATEYISWYSEFGHLRNFIVTDSEGLVTRRCWRAASISISISSSCSRGRARPAGVLRSRHGRRRCVSACSHGGRRHVDRQLHGSSTRPGVRGTAPSIGALTAGTTAGRCSTIRSTWTTWCARQMRPTSTVRDRVSLILQYYIVALSRCVFQWRHLTTIHWTLSTGPLV